MAYITLNFVIPELKVYVVKLPPSPTLYYISTFPANAIIVDIAKYLPSQPWPLMGGKWGEESPHISTDLIITGLVYAPLKSNPLHR